MEQTVLDKETAIYSQFDSLRQNISHQGIWTVRHCGDFVELWAELDSEQTEYALPLSFENAVAIPQGQVTDSVLTVPQGSERVYISGKEKS